MVTSSLTKEFEASSLDEELANRAPGDFEAFAELYRRYLCPVFRFMRSQTPNDATAEDLTAQVFFKALDNAASFRGDGSYRSWIFRIAHNTLYTWRGRKTREVVGVEEVPDPVDPAPTPALRAISTERRGIVWGAIAKLPPAQREVVALRYVEDLEIAEIADITGRSKGAVRIILHRARQKLRQLLEGVDL